jgi:hypothetical protein
MEFLIDERDPSEMPTLRIQSSVMLRGAVANFRLKESGYFRSLDRRGPSIAGERSGLRAQQDPFLLGTLITHSRDSIIINERVMEDIVP